MGVYKQVINCEVWDMSTIDDPESVMLKIFVIIVDRVRQEATLALGTPPIRFGMSIDSTGYDRALHIPSRTFDYNTPSFIFHKFSRVEQSARVLSLVGKNLTIVVTTSGSPSTGTSLPKAIQPSIVGGSGCPYIDNQAAVSGDDSGDESEGESSDSEDSFIDNEEYSDEGLPPRLPSIFM